MKLFFSDNEELKAALDGSSLNVTQLNSALDKTQVDRKKKKRAFFFEWACLHVQLDLAQVREENSSLIEQVSQPESLAV